MAITIEAVIEQFDPPIKKRRGRPFLYGERIFMMIKKIPTHEWTITAYSESGNNWG